MIHVKTYQIKKQKVMQKTKKNRGLYWFKNYSPCSITQAFSHWAKLAIFKNQIKTSNKDNVSINTSNRGRFHIEAVAFPGTNLTEILFTQ